MSEILTQLKHLLPFEKRGQKPSFIEAYGSWGSLPRLIAACLGNQLKGPVLYITAHITHAFEAQDDLETFLGKSVGLFPAAEAHETDLDPTSEIACERLRICRQLSTTNNHNPQIIVTPIAALMQPVPNVQFLQSQSLKLTTGQNLEMNELLHWLDDHNFTRVDQIDLVGEFACRGGIIDVFPPAENLPVRIELFGDQIESLRSFDLDTQRSVHHLETVNITGCNNIRQAADGTSFLDYLPTKTTLLIEETTEVAEIGRLCLGRLADPSDIYPVENVLQTATKFDTFYLNRFSSGIDSAAINLRGQSVQQFENRWPEVLEELLQIACDQHVYLFCEKPAQKQRLLEMIETDFDVSTLPKGFHLTVGYIHHGFAIPGEKLLVLSHHELFGQHQPQRRISRIQPTQAIDSFTDLAKGDLVVHVNHGIGRFRGMKTLTKHDHREEYLAIEYADKAIVHVPATKIQLIHKYVGARGGRTKLSKLGGRTWTRQKQKVTEAVEDMASQFIDLQAHRQSIPGIAFPPDTPWQREFEESFAYQETEDQTTVNVQIKNDMQQNRPMDRLLCGDVGYGKTELAIRAVFKTVEYGKQVAVLVPTTVLAQQHFRTFNERLADFPFIVECLSRLNTAGQTRDIIKRTAQGQVDILIGTHRILSDDIIFKDLGLVVIDEEQRFGVNHKEKLKRMRKTVDILTMTATPIPRTLHMALLGIRDISSLTSPPLDRRSIVTEVCPFDKQRIRSIILRELNRQGQIYFLHNRVHSIADAAHSIEQLVPEARIIAVHGRMAKRQLEDRMSDFVNHKADILVCTTIIESGLDIPNVNTIIIADADRFGLAELHQLRGRVGRYKHRAYAYMLLPTKRSINPTAVKRLKAIEEYSQLGCGFRIALRDLEIRGAGNILGIEQSGYIDTVGYELYCQLLAGAVRRKRNEPEPVSSITHLELNVSNNIPRGYIPSDRQRMDVYRRLATCSTSQDFDQLEHDLIDLFGQPPSSVRDLLELTEIRIMASQHNIRSIIQKQPDLIFHLHDSAQVSLLFANAPGSVRVPDQNTVHLRLTEPYFDSPKTIMATLRKILTSK